MGASMGDSLSYVTTHARPTVPARRATSRSAGRAAVLLSAPAVALLASPAYADVPEGWSEPKAVDNLQALLLLAGGPILLFVLIALAVYLPSMVRGERLLPDHSGGDAQWLGGPRAGARELPPAGTDDSRTGGASGSW